MPYKLKHKLDSFELPPHPLYADGYWLVRRATLRKTAAPEYGPGKYFYDEYDICFKLSQESVRKTGRVWSKGVRPHTGKNDHGRVDLKLSLRRKGKPRENCTTNYCHLVACALLRTSRDTRGRPCAPHYINPMDHGLYEADHNPLGDQCDCRLANLVLEHVDLHRGRERDGWQRTSLPASRRGLRRPLGRLRVLRLAQKKL